MTEIAAVTVNIDVGQLIGGFFAAVLTTTQTVIVLQNRRVAKRQIETHAAVTETANAVNGLAHLAIEGARAQGQVTGMREGMPSAANQSTARVEIVGPDPLPVSVAPPNTEGK